MVRSWKQQVQQGNLAQEDPKAFPCWRRYIILSTSSGSASESSPKGMCQEKNGATASLLWTRPRSVDWPPVPPCHHLWTRLSDSWTLLKTKLFPDPDSPNSPDRSGTWRGPGLWAPPWSWGDVWIICCYIQKCNLKMFYTRKCLTSPLTVHTDGQEDSGH